MDLRQFLDAVVTTTTGKFLVGLKNETVYKELFFDYPDDIDKIVELAQAAREFYDVYFTAHLFRNGKSTKDNVLPSRTIQADLDSANVLELPKKPSILIQTSKGRHQGYWIIEESVNVDVLERLSKKLTYSIDECDKSGWSLGHRVRLPTTFNHKYDNTQAVEIVSSPLKVYKTDEIDSLTILDYESDIVKDVDWIDSVKPEADVGPNELLESIKNRVPRKVYLNYNKVANDRSSELWSLMCSAFRAGLDRDNVYYLAYHSANNKFSGLRYNGDRELAKDVVRAERVAKQVSIDSISNILAIRRAKSPSHEKRSHIAQEVFNTLSATGEFVRTSDDKIWYVQRALGRPIQISSHSEYLSMILELQFGLNASEVEHNYTVNNLSSRVHNMEPSAFNASLSYYDSNNTSVLLHTGRRDVLRITPDKVERVTNGTFGVLFPWSLSNEPFQPSYGTVCDSWYNAVFSFGNNTIDISPLEAEVLIRTWFLFLLFRSTSISRPILSLFGQPGAGKSTLFRRIYALLYGGSRGLSSVTSADDFDHSVSSDPLVVLDNVDTWERWLADRLALSAASSDIQKRKLYTDTDLIILKRQALIGLTAHSPKFVRADVADRLIVIMLKRLENFLPELDIINNILLNRNSLWGQIVIDIQTILRTPKPDLSEIPQFRINDFARTGLWIARALNIEPIFKEALIKVTAGQKAISLEEDGMLVGAIAKFVEKRGKDTWRTPTQLWSELEVYASDSISFRRIYKNPIILGKKIWTLQDALRQVFKVECKYDAVRGARVWQFAPKSGE